MSSKLSTVRLVTGGERFEILVHPEGALNFKLGRKVEISQVIAADEIYSDSSKGLRVSSEKLLKHFQSQDVTKVAEQVLRRGELLLTTEQRRKLIEDKRKQVVSLIARNYVDPKTGLPHPPLRIEHAMQQVNISLDAFKPAEEQVKAVVDQIRTILPLKSERIKVMVKVPAQFTAQALGALKSHGTVVKEEWGADGSLTAVVELIAGAHASLLDRLGALSKGSVQATVLR